MLQVFIKNSGGEIAIVTRARLSVKRIWHLRLQRPLMQHLEAYASYNIEIDLARAAPYDIEIPVSHSIDPNKADRFDITVGLKPLEPFENIYHVEVSLCFDKQWNPTNAIDGVIVLPARLDSEPQYLIGAFQRYMNQLKEARSLIPADFSGLPEYKQRHWKRRKKDVDRDLSPEGVKKALQAAQEIDEFNRTILLEAAQASVLRSPRASDLISRVTVDTQGSHSS